MFKKLFTKLITVIHTIGHIFNFEYLVSGHRISLNFNSTRDDDSGLISTLSNLQTNNPVNPVTGTITIFEAFKLLPGVTGICVCLVLCLILSSSSEYIRRSFFNLFWYLHQILAVLFVLFFICMCNFNLLIAIKYKINNYH